MNRLPSEIAPNRTRILVVDDLPDNYILLQTVLEGEGYQVDIADSGLAAIAKITENPPDLVLLDVMMPEMNGFEVTQQIRQNPEFSLIPVLLVTGYGEPEHNDYLNLQVDGYIYKPIDFDQLLHQIRTLLSLQER